jgi:uncharacterized repeat protein (TIGR01451 family)
MNERPGSAESRGATGIVRWAALTGMLLASCAAAEVTLNTSVQKVEHEPGPAGAVIERLVDVQSVLPGERLRYTIVFANEGELDAIPGSIVITNPLPQGVRYVEGSATGRDTLITFSIDGETFAVPGALRIPEGATNRPAEAADYRSIRWAFEPGLAAGESGVVSFDVDVGVE